MTLNLHHSVGLIGIVVFAFGLSTSAAPDDAQMWANAVSQRGDDARSAVSPAAGPIRVPEGLSAADWSGIRAVQNANRHAVVVGEDGTRARNPAQRWWTNFDGRGFLTAPDSGGWSWGLELVSYGLDGAEESVSRPQHVSADGQRVEYEWDETLTEWYVNDAHGLEHGYTLHHRPRPLPPSSRGGPREGRGEGGQASPECEPVCITLAVRGDLCPQERRGGRDVQFVNAAGAAVVNYNGLVVFDADGATLPARFDPVPGGMRLTVDDGGARYPLTIDPFAQQAYLKASNTGSSDNFGASVAASGDTVLVGAFGEASDATGVNGDQSNNSANASGAAYVFVCDARGSCNQQAYLKASNTDANDQFGVSVAVSGDTVVVGANGEDSNATGVNGNQGNETAGGSGAAYVFVRNGATWSQQAYLKASNTEAIDFFGESVAVSGNTVVVGASGEDSNATGVNGGQGNNDASHSGAAYVFVRNGTTWTQQAYLKASNTDEGDHFGSSVAVSSNTVVVGATDEESNATGVNGDQGNNGAFQSGAAYVFVRDGATWTQQAYLKASNTDADDRFGHSVAVSGDTVVVGAWREDSDATGVNGNGADNTATNSGAAYAFIRDAATWTQQAYLKASNTGADDQFGYSVAVSGDIVVAGAKLEDSDATGVDGDGGDNSADASGATYVFVRDGATWTQQAYLKASNTGAGDEFGDLVAVSDGTIVVGARMEDSNATGVNGNGADNSTTNSGAAYAFAFVVDIPCSTPDFNGNGVCCPAVCPPPNVPGNCLVHINGMSSGMTCLPGNSIPDGAVVDCECATPTGACCGDGVCTPNVTALDCAAMGGAYQGDASDCMNTNCAGIPTVSQWGVIVMLLLLSSAGTIVFARRRVAKPAA